MKRIAIISAALILALTSCEQSPKYVFYMIGDGMGINQAVGTQIYNEALGMEDPSINFLGFPVRTFVTTHCSSSLVTDSAAAGTALSTGEKTYMGAMGVGDDKEPLVGITEKAIAAGYGAGVVTTVGVNHATPAAFYAHTDNRNNYDTIAQQLFASKLSFVAGGGFNTERKVGKTADDYVADALEAGWEVYCGKDDFAGLNSTGKVICLGGSSSHDLKYAIDRTDKDTKLADFTKAAVDHLYRNHKNGFFLMVEGGSIDHSAHDDDGATTFCEVNDFADAIEVALEFYRKHPKQTLIVVTADHETGGLMLGAGRYEIKPQNIVHQKVSEPVLSSTLKALATSPETPSWEQVKAVISEALGLWTEVEVDPRTDARFHELYEQTFLKKNASDVQAWYSSNSALASEAVDYLNEVSGFGWSFSSHSGSPVGVFAIGAGSESLASVRDNTDIPKVVSSLAGYGK